MSKRKNIADYDETREDNRDEPYVKLLLEKK